MSVHIEPFVVRDSNIDGLKIISAKMVSDERGTVRGLHGEAMSKLVTVAYGSVFGAYVDTRPDSKTFGAVQTVHITPGVQVFVPQGVCNGFQALEDTEYLYFFDKEVNL